MLSSRPISITSDIDVPQSILTAKTPGRKLKGRNALQENAVFSGSKTVFSKKSLVQTPFRPPATHGKKPTVSISVIRPLADKTPFPNRVAAANFGTAGNAGKTPGIKLSKLALLAPEPQQEALDIAPLLRPSSARKSLRGRLSGANLKTPFTKGNYWDVSPGDMEGIAGVVLDGKQETETVVDEDDDEIEYMPPPCVELPYEPPFELPDYKAVGCTLFELAHGVCMDDTADAYYALDIERQIDVKQLLADTGFKPDSFDNGLDLPELGDDSPFARKPTTASSSSELSAPVTKLTAPLSRTQLTAPTTRTTAPLTRARSAVLSKPATAISGPSSRPQTRAVTATASTSRIGVPAPGQTRTSALRAAKAASTGAASTPNPARPAATGSRRPAPNTTVATQEKPIARSAATGKTRSTTVAAKASTRAGPSTVGGNAVRLGKTGEGGNGDPLATMLETMQAGAGGEDFLFNV